MLLQRVLTALVLIPLVVAGVFLLSQSLFELIICLLLLVGAWEWAALSGIRSIVGRALYSGLVAGLMLMGGLWLSLMWLPMPIRLVETVAIAWLLIALPIIRFRGTIRVVPNLQIGIALIGVIVLLVTALSMAKIHAQAEIGPKLFMSLLLLVWVADSAAYFAGRRWGKRKLAPVLSPGKTLEGAAGALVATMLLAGALAIFNELSGRALLSYLVLAFLVLIISIVGDLSESWLKRRAGVKDSGHVLPGHGGILDRIDSLLAASPVYALGIGIIFS